MVASTVFLPGGKELSNILMGFSAVVWVFIYTLTPRPHIFIRLSGRFSFEEELDSLKHEYRDFEEIAIELEKTLYIQRKYYSYVRMATFLMIYSILMSAFGFEYLYLI
jgi:hypothetical protein